MKRSIEVVIIGAGPAGISAAIWCKRLGIDHLLLESKSAIGGQLSNIQNKIIDYPGLMSKNGQELQKHFQRHVEKLGCRLRLNTTVLSIDLPHRQIIAQERNKEPERISFQYLIYAAGSTSRKLNVPGEEEMIERGELYSATRDGSLFQQKRVAMIGGGDRALEGALLLANQGARVSLVHRSDRFRARRDYVKQVGEHPNVEIYKRTTVERIDGDDRVRGVYISRADGEKSYLPVEGVFVRIGVKPNSGLLKGIVEMDEDEYIQRNHMFQTSEPNIFAIGDVCTKANYTSVSAAIGQGMIASKSISMLLS